MCATRADLLMPQAARKQPHLSQFSATQAVRKQFSDYFAVAAFLHKLSE